MIVVSEDVIKLADNSSLEKRLEKLEKELEQLKSVIFGENSDETVSEKSLQCAGRDLNPGQGLGKPLC